MPWPEAVTLEGTHVRLELLSHDHGPALCESVKDGELWQLWFTAVPSPDGMAAEIERRLGLRASGSMLPFAVIDPATDQAVGMTTYMNIDAVTPRFEIGSTWYRRAVQRSPLNTECKSLLLRRAFEALGCVAVEFRTHVLNHPSRRAIERLGAKLDGILRNHTRTSDGMLRDTCVYSIIASEWPTIKANLAWQMTRPRQL